MGTIIRLFLVGVLVVVFFKIAAAMLPYVLLGFLVLYIVRHYRNKDKKEVVIRSDE